MPTRTTAPQLEPRKVAQQPRSQATVEAIVEAAAQVFERDGYGAATTNRIAERAGVSIGSLYQYFPNKDAILVALTRRHLAEGAATLQPHLQRLADGAPWDEVLPGLVDATVSIHAAAPTLHRVLFEETRLPATVRDELEALEQELVELTVQALGAAPSTRRADPRLAASVVVNAIEGLTHRLVLHPSGDVEPDAIAREITALVRAYLNSDVN